ncbi:hypothetical protein AVEN_155095-1 [Araneus ventricosus]|uniref:Uncharacterized protein n=1 Tax=Araneus ventricosus TaxID=182803 RepID=A0A4Y2A9A4_ARAVE|nr:hypothetical protein AVEN_155095-1 [Araneus ventricosus]
MCALSQTTGIVFTLGPYTLEYSQSSLKQPRSWNSFLCVHNLTESQSFDSKPRQREDPFTEAFPARQPPKPSYLSVVCSTLCKYPCLETLMRAREREYFSPRIEPEGEMEKGLKRELKLLEWVRR